jgi:NADH:ubiquinone oxidoreductase subunit 3 (subunit A)
MNQQRGRDTPPSGSGNDDTRHLSARGLLIVFAGLAVALLLGYLLLNKLVDMSREEDCALAHRYNCGAVEVPR